MTLEISSTLAARLLNEAAASPDAEECGLLFGTPDRIDAVERCANVAENPADTFEIDPTALFAAYRGMRTGARAIIGCYHSHPNGSCAPSRRDRAGSVGDGMIWLILGGDRIAAWRASAPGVLEPVPLQIDDPA
jgi:proteasome lid subunit RPN8/RPN11